MTYTIAVIGCGVIGQRLGQAFAKYDKIELKYAVDLDAEVLDTYCERFGTKGYTDYRSVLELDDVDIVYVGVPPKWHAEMTLDALDAGKHVICEKPIGISAEEGHQMTAKAEETGLVTAINFPFKYTPSFAKMKSMVDAWELGDIQKVTIKIRMPQWPRAWQNVPWLQNHDQGGPLREIGSHFIYGVQEIFGPIEVKQSEVELTEPTKFEKEIQVQFTTGDIPARLDLLTLEDEEEENTLYIRGSKGQVRFRGWYILEKWENNEWVIIDDSRIDNSIELSKEVVRAIEGEGKLVSFAEATEVQSVVDRIFADI